MTKPCKEERILATEPDESKPPEFNFKISWSLKKLLFNITFISFVDESMLFVFDYNEKIQLINLSDVVIFNQSLESFTCLNNCKIEINSDHKMIS